MLNNFSRVNYANIHLQYNVREEVIAILYLKLDIILNVAQTILK